MSTCNRVIKQFFQGYYEDRINKIKSMPPKDIETFDLSVLTFWSSIIDFYGGIYYLAKGYERKVHGYSGNLKLAHGRAFTLFIEDFFPAPENQMGEFFYDIYRCGIVHQMCAKKSHVHLTDQSGKNRFIWLEEDANPNARENKQAHVNLLRLQELTYEAYYSFKDKIERNLDPIICQRIYDQLLAPSDGLEDGKSLDKEFNKLLNKNIDLRTI